MNAAAAFTKDFRELGYGVVRIHNYKKNGEMFAVTLTMFPIFDSLTATGIDSETPVLTHFATILSDIKPVSGNTSSSTSQPINHAQSQVQSQQVQSQVQVSIQIQQKQQKQQNSDDNNGNTTSGNTTSETNSSKHTGSYSDSNISANSSSNGNFDGSLTNNSSSSGGEGSGLDASDIPGSSGGIFDKKRKDSHRNNHNNHNHGHSHGHGHGHVNTNESHVNSSNNPSNPNMRITGGKTGRVSPSETSSCSDEHFRKHSTQPTDADMAALQQDAMKMESSPRIDLENAQKKSEYENQNMNLFHNSKTPAVQVMNHPRNHIPSTAKSLSSGSGSISATSSNGNNSYDADASLNSSESLPASTSPSVSEEDSTNNDNMYESSSPASNAGEQEDGLNISGHHHTGKKLILFYVFSETMLILIMLCARSSTQHE